ncbi:hypothetical protein STCU_04409 [Strigomonas culicis]|uniref:Uncharacterized protein n=1 Tax=Strigomonas culicis TaxID=28005 RepID=S9UFN6_9TRYP|nr:hypothetical protein STCU_04409 [Strigomonas culicis]|eukprot:EPY29612.1 hypothetical protein STCU_04409 [Strigomonas culicis]
MWKQNELWRNVHEAQFEHLRRVYKRQWLESFRVNADEYIYKYNITKAAQLAQWEHEMHAQEKKRRENQQMAQGRQALKKKHLDLLREFHERQFFYWYERASERLQYMNHINYIPQSEIQDHLERELNKYVVGSKAPYPLNFAGQMPMLEDGDGNIAQVPETLMTNHATENQDSAATMYQPPQGTALAEERLLEIMASAQEEELNMVDGAVLAQSLADINEDADSRDKDAKVTLSMEQTEEEREVGRRAYIDRGKTGSRALRRPRFDADGQARPVQDDATPMRRRKSKLDKAHALQQQQDAMAQKVTTQALGGASDTTKIGEVPQSTGRLLDKAAVPSADVLLQNPALAAGSKVGARVHVQDMVDKKYNRGKYKKAVTTRRTCDR